jgi:hypothetical protein
MDVSTVDKQALFEGVNAWNGRLDEGLKSEFGESTIATPFDGHLEQRYRRAFRHDRPP